MPGEERTSSLAFFISALRTRAPCSSRPGSGSEARCPRGARSWAGRPVPAGRGTPRRRVRMPCDRKKAELMQRSRTSRRPAPPAMSSSLKSPVVMALCPTMMKRLTSDPPSLGRPVCFISCLRSLRLPMKPLTAFLELLYCCSSSPHVLRLDARTLGDAVDAGGLDELRFLHLRVGHGVHDDAVLVEALLRSPPR